MGNCTEKLKKSLLVILAVIALFFSCEKKPSSAVTEREGGDEIRALFVSPYKKADASSFKWLSELCAQKGLDVRWEVLSEEEWQAEKEERLSSANAPDLLINAATSEDYARHPEFFVNLAQFVGYDTPNLSLMYKENKDLSRASTMYSGAVYAFPSYSSLEWQQLFAHSTKCVIFINQQWLKNLNLPIPDTFSDLEEVLSAFRKYDCNGDGSAFDEIPFDFYGWAGNPHSALMLLGGFGVQFTDGARNGFFAENGEVKNCFSDERYKYFLSILARWYKTGLIRDAALTSDFSGFLARSHGGKNREALVGMCLGTEETAQFGEELASQYRAILPPVMQSADLTDAGISAPAPRRFWNTDSLTIKPDRISMSAQCPKKEAVISLIDSLYSTDWSVQSVFGGILDGVVEKNGDFDFIVHTNLDFSNSFGEAGPHFLDDMLQLSLPDSFIYAQLERNLYQKLQVKKDCYYPEMYMKYPLEQLKALSEMEGKITKIAENARLRWIRGEGDINSEWDSYLQDLELAGLSSAVRARQAAFNRYLKK